MIRSSAFIAVATLVLATPAIALAHAFPTSTNPPGAYKAIWHATAVDTHKTEGGFRFTVAR